MTVVKMVKKASELVIRKDSSGKVINAFNMDSCTMDTSDIRRESEKVMRHKKWRAVGSGQLTTSLELEVKNKCLAYSRAAPSKAT